MYTQSMLRNINFSFFFYEIFTFYSSKKTNKKNKKNKKKKLHIASFCNELSTGNTNFFSFAFKKTKVY